MSPTTLADPPDTDRKTTQKARPAFLPTLVPETPDCCSIPEGPTFGPVAMPPAKKTKPKRKPAK